MFHPRQGIAIAIAESSRHLVHSADVGRGLHTAAATHVSKKEQRFRDEQRNSMDFVRTNYPKDPTVLKGLRHGKSNELLRRSVFTMPRHPESKKRKSSERNTIEILWPVKAIFREEGGRYFYFP